ncbi:hypothetical protein [Arthrobacter sp.]|uniref:hypothetical protein n=1 Tax=Arthrobacter sp. TaxID=1667 RepID=UPI00258BB8A1|nr:hypothetical protein [Arthrobacter sp.]
MPKLSVLTWIGNAAARLFGTHGDISTQARQARCSRQTVYDHAAKVHQAVAQAQSPGPSPQALRDELRQLREENRQLWEWLNDVADGPKQRRRQFAVTAAAMGLSLQQTLTLLAILLPARLLPSRPTLGRWVQHSARRAGRLLAVLDAACRPLVLCLCLDEIFCRRRPVLMAIEPHSLAWVVGRRSADRSGPAWSQVLAAWPALTDVAADAGSGLELGIALADRARRQAADKARIPATPLHSRLDVFHTRREGERALRGAWSSAQALWEQAEKVGRAKARFDRRGIDRKQFSKARVEKAWRPAEAAFHEAQRQEQAWQRAVAALAVFRPDGRLNDRAWAAAQLRAAAAELSGPRWAKTRRLLLDERTLTFLDRLHEALTAAEPEPRRREALALLWNERRQRRRSPAPDVAAVVQQALSGVVVRHLGPGWVGSYRRVARVLRRVVRASSAVECVNSVVRMHQARHRHLTQELLDLKRLYWNCRRFAWGPRRRRCPYEHLGLGLPSYDPWELLQMDPAELSQQLSSPQLAA